MSTTIGFAMCGSFCTFARVLPQMEALCSAGYEVIPIQSAAAHTIDTRFGNAADFSARIEAMCGRPIIHTLFDAEPIGPKKLLDALVIAPCTGNTLGKLAAGIYDSPVTLAAKAHLRNERPVVIAVSTNDALAGSAPALGRLLAQKHYYFVPMRQDDPVGKPASLVADFAQIRPALEAALQNRQIQPVLC